MLYRKTTATNRLSGCVCLPPSRFPTQTHPQRRETMTTNGPFGCVRLPANRLLPKSTQKSSYIESMSKPDLAARCGTLVIDRCSALYQALFPSSVSKTQGPNPPSKPDLARCGALMIVNRLSDLYQTLLPRFPRQGREGCLLGPRWWSTAAPCCTQALLSFTKFLHRVLMSSLPCSLLSLLAVNTRRLLTW